MKIDLNKSQREIPELNPLTDYDYEQIFKLYQEDTGHFGYNILRTVHIPSDLDPQVFEYVRISGKQSWTQASYGIYGTIKLWWLLCITNKILNPVILPAPGMTIRVIKKQYVSDILSQIRDQL